MKHTTPSESQWKEIFEQSFSHARACGLPYHDACDCAQSVAMGIYKLLRCAGALSSTVVNVNAFVNASTRHEIGRLSRKRDRERAPSLASLTGIGAVKVTGEAGFCDRRMSAEIDVFLERLDARLRASRDPADSQALIVLACMNQGMSIKQMAEWLGVPLRTMYRIHLRAIERLALRAREVAVEMGCDDLPRELAELARF